MSKTILIAGSDGRIGKYTSELFKRNDWNVIGIDIKQSSSNEFLDKFIACDVKDALKVKEVVAEIEAVNAIDAVFNAAGYEIDSNFENTSNEAWAELLDTILGGSANLCGAVAPYMIKREEGKLILLSTDYSQVQGDCVMNATAAGTLHGYAKSFGVEVASNNILVNAIFANAPFDMDAVAQTVLFLADKDTYTSAQVISVTGLNS